MREEPFAGLAPRPGDLVALRLPPGAAWPPAVDRLWGAGAALLPVDSRLPEDAAAELVARARPTAAVDARGARRLGRGAPVDPGVALVVPTSGTTGRPRLVELSGAAVEAAVRASARALGVDGGAPWLCPLPPAHIGGLLVVLRGVLLGGPVTVLPRFDPAALAAAPPGACVSVVPTMLRRLLDAGARLAHLGRVLVGGAGLDAELARRARARGVPLVATYGLTEACGGVVYDGRPLEGVEVRAAGDSDELQVRGPTLMRSYRFDPAASAAAFTGDAWLHTGDTGSVRGGVVRVRGRLGDLIVSGGEKVWPHEVEAALRGHPAVADVAVAGRVDPEWGERVVAFVVPRSGLDPPLLDELRDTVSRTLPRYTAPRELVLVEALERTALGKLRRPQPPG